MHIGLEGMTKEERRDRLSLDLMGLRERLEGAAVEPGQPLSSVLRGVALIGIEILEVCTKLNIPTPKIGQVEEWVKQFSLGNKIPYTAVPSLDSASELLNLLSSPIRPTDVEIVKIASRLNLDTETLMNVCDRLYSSKEVFGNGH